MTHGPDHEGLDRRVDGRLGGDVRDQQSAQCARMGRHPVRRSGAVFAFCEVRSEDRDFSPKMMADSSWSHYGAQLVRLLAERGWIVLATDMKPPPSDPVATWGQSAVEYTQLDLGEVEAEAEIDRLVSRCDCVLHLGACERDTASDCIAAAARAAACAAAPATPADTTAFCGCMHLTLWCVSPLAGGRGRRPWSFAGSPGRHTAGRPRRQLLGHSVHASEAGTLRGCRPSGERREVERCSPDDVSGHLV